MTTIDLLYLANEVLTLRRFCPDHPMPLPKPSCPDCARNAGLVAAARLIRDTEEELHEHEWSEWSRSASCESRYCVRDFCDAGEIR